MSRAYIVYILMFLALIGGLAVIVELGGAMKAPDDLSGDWTVTWKSLPPVDMAGPTIRIDQSGRFFNLRFSGQRKPISLTLQPGWKGARDGRTLRMQLAGEFWKANITGDYPGMETWKIPQVQMELIDASGGSHVGTAVRVGLPAATTRPAGVASGVAHVR